MDDCLAKPCENNATWSDNPGPIPGSVYDLQSTAAQLFGVALGLNTSLGNHPDSTMYSLTFRGETKKRSIHPDDIAGVQTIYGTRVAAKPRLVAIAVDGMTLTLAGANFDATSNEVWFGSDAATAPATDPIVRVTNVPSTNGGTVIVVTAPASARPGDVLVRVPGTGNQRLSNAFPISFPVYPNSSCPSELPTDPVLADSGGDVVAMRCFAMSPPLRTYHAATRNHWGASSPDNSCRP